MRTYDYPQCKYTHFDWGHCPFPRQFFNPSLSRAHHLSRDSESDMFHFLGLCVLILSHSLDLNVAHQIKKVSDEKIEGMITFSHVYEFFILFQDSQSVGQISVLSGLNRRSRRIFSQLLFAIQLLPRCEPWGLTAQALVSSG